MVAWLDEHPGYLPEGWDSRLLAPLAFAPQQWSPAPPEEEEVEEEEEEAVLETWAYTPRYLLRLRDLRGLRNNDATLTALYLNSKNIGAAGVSAIAAALKVNRILTVLNLSDNSFGDAGASTLAEALKVNRTLTTLGLGSNSIGTAGASAMAEALKVNSTLTVLKLWNNSIGAAGVRALRSSVRSGCELNVDDNPGAGCCIIA